MSPGGEESTSEFGGAVEGVPYKWGVNAKSGELTVWEVGGPGDGFPGHREALAKAWGREANIDSGDVLGSTIVTDTTVAIVIYGASDEPKKRTEAAEVVAGWARATFPHHRVVVDGSAAGLE